MGAGAGAVTVAGAEVGTGGANICGAANGWG